jgi:fido (protein-threonine AMPylation protein)
VPSKTKPSNKLCQSCAFDSRRVVEGQAYCRTNRRLCDVVDRRLIELAAEERGEPQKLEVLEDMAKSIEARHGAAQLGIEMGAEALPRTAEEFIEQAEIFHMAVFGGTGLSFAGHFRDEPVRYGKGKNERDGVASEQIRPSLANLFIHVPFPSKQKLQAMSERDFLRFCARFLREFFAIHPFLDGNGRTARLFLLLFARETGRFRFKTFTDRGQDQKYVKALEYAHKRADPRVPGEAGEETSDPYKLLVMWLANCLDRDYTASRMNQGAQISEANPPTG